MHARISSLLVPSLLLLASACGDKVEDQSGTTDPNSGTLTTGEQPSGGGSGGNQANGPVGPLPSGMTIVKPSGAINTKKIEVVLSPSLDATKYYLTIGREQDCSDALLELSYDQTTENESGGYPEIIDTPSRAFEDGAYYACGRVEGPGGTVKATNDGQSFTVDTTAPQDQSTLVVTSGEALGELDVTVDFGTEKGTSGAVYFVEGSSTIDCSFPAGSPPVSTIPIQRTEGVSLYNYRYTNTDLIGKTLSVRVCLRDEAGNATAGASDTAVVQNRQRVFATSVKFSPVLIGDYQNANNGGTFGSPFHGADYRCNFLAAAANRRGKWKAVISTSNYDAKTLITAYGPLYNLSDEQLTASKDVMWAGLSGSGKIKYDETGALIGGMDGKAWTGTKADGTKDADTCNDWSNAAGNGMQGDAQATGNSWIESGSVTCSSSERLICVESLH